MPVGIAPTPSDSPVGQQKKGSAASVATIPFSRASKWHVEISNTQSGIALTGANAQVFNFPVASYGYLSAVFITVQLTGGAGGSSLVYFEDAPWSLLSQVQLSDVNGVPLHQLSGFHSYLQAKYGGYRPFAPDAIVKGASTDANTAQTIISSAGTPSGILTGPNGLYYSPPSATTGNCKFILPIWLEFGNDGLGCLPNMDASARYNLQLTVAGSPFVNNAAGPFEVSGTAPTTVPTMTITIHILARSQPPAADMFGNQNSVSPPAVGTVQYWTAQTASGLANGQNTIQLTRVGNLIRNHILIFRNGTTNPPRQNAETTDMPSIFEFDWDVGQRYVCGLDVLRFWQAYISYGFDVPNGVIVLPDTLDPDKLPFSEYGDEWMGTVGATKLTLRFTTGAGSGSLTILTNDIVPASGQVYQAPALMVG